MTAVKMTVGAFLLTLLLAVCAAPSTPTPTSTPTLPPAVEVRFGVASLDNPEGVRFLNSVIAMFEKSHPNITIVPQVWGWESGWNSRDFAEQLAAGAVPDVMSVPATEGWLLIDHGYAPDITDLMNEWPVARDFNMAILAPYMKEGRIYAVPTHVYILGLFYDKALFRAAGLVDADGEPLPPATWEEFVHTAQVIKEKTGAAGFCAFTHHNQGGWTFMNWGWQAGGEFERQEDGKWRAVFDEPPIVAALQFIKDLRWKYDVLQEEILLDAGQSFPLAAKHQCGMAIYAPEWFTFIVDQHGGDPDDLGLTILPAGPAGRVNLMGGSYAVLNLNAPPEVQRAAFEWITWSGFDPQVLDYRLASESGSASRWTASTRSLLYKPNSATARMEQDLLDKYRGIPYYGAYSREAGQYARPEPPIATQDLYAVLDGVIQAVLTDPDADPQALLSAAAAQFQAEHLDRQD